MAYELDDGVAGQVEGESFCMKKNFHVRDVERTNQLSGYHDMGDLANTPKFPTPETGAKANKQNGPMAANASRNDAKGKAY